MWTVHFACVRVRVAQRDVAVQVDLVVVPDEFEDRDMEAAGEGDAILRHPDGVVLRVWAPSLYDDVAESVAAVARRRGPAHVHDEYELVYVCPLHENAHKQDVSSGEHHLPLPVRMTVRGVLIQGHLGDEVPLLGWQGEVDHASKVQ